MSKRQVPSYKQWKLQIKVIWESQSFDKNPIASLKQVLNKVYRLWRRTAHE